MVRPTHPPPHPPPPPTQSGMRCSPHLGFLADLYKELLVFFNGIYELRNETYFLLHSSLTKIQRYGVLVQHYMQEVGLVHGQ